MHKLRSPGGRRGIGVHVVRIAALSAALLTMTGIVVEDVIAAEPGAQALLLLLEEGVDSEALAPVLLAAAVVVPDAMQALNPEPPELEPGPEPPRKKRRPRVKFGRFEGY
jgi:hypothetical protein